MSALYAVTSSISLGKTVRDQHEASRVVARVDEARFERLLTEHDPYTPPAEGAPRLAPLPAHVRQCRVRDPRFRGPAWPGHVRRVGSGWTGCESRDLVRRRGAPGATWAPDGSRRRSPASGAEDGGDVEVVHRAFELDPTVPAEGMDLGGYLARKFGVPTG